MVLLVETAFANQTVEGSWRRVLEVSTLCIPALFCAVDSSRFQASSLLGFRLSLLCFLTSVSTVSVSSFPQFVLLFAVEPVNTRFDPRWRSTAKCLTALHGTPRLKIPSSRIEALLLQRFGKLPSCDPNVGSCIPNLQTLLTAGQVENMQLSC